MVAVNLDEDRPGLPGAETSLARVAEAYAADADRLVALAHLVTGDAHAAEDLAHEVLTEAVRRERLESGFLRDPAWPWLRVVLMRLALRRRRRMAMELSRLARLYERPREEMWTPDTAEYLAALRTLPPRMRACAVLFYVEDMSTGQVADALGCAPRTVENQLRAARRRLASQLKADQSSAEEMSQ